MKEETHLVKEIHGVGQGSYKTYITGFVLSIILTLAAFFLVGEHSLSKENLLIAVVALGAVQVIVQFVFFLHLGMESKPRWNLLVFSFMALVLVIIVIGSLWIMHNLDTRVMTPMEVHDYMIREQ